MRKVGSVVLSLYLLITLTLLPAAAQKRKVTVMDFGYGTVKKDVAAIFGTDQDIGKGIADQLITQLLNQGDYRLIERSHLDKIIAEQNLSNSDRADPATAAKIGGVLGVDAIIIGDVTTFGNDDKHTNVSGNGNTGWLGKAAAGGLGVNKSKAVVEITARIIDVNTSEILASVTGRGEAQKKGLSLGGGGSNGWWNGGGGGGGQVDFGSSNFQETIIGQAVKAAVTEVATNLDTKAASLPPPTEKPMPQAPPLDGQVADASSSDIIVNVGSKNGVKVGDTLAIKRVDRVINDPVTGKPLRAIETLVGTLTISSVDPDSAVGKFSGTGAPKVGDHVKRQASN
ncbi:hypothetical protein ACPOL_1789 [Acidisarcina polymorpha]|uniref:Flagellar assembly protein T C-terminal domain-containing protein n=1 Tax=Acidisarcina polymorpha TaxID=2211140 RepID=A0A2Z5FWC1_9BACT|nr:CsgG/HfaB family protein [Acidisarcina polymorpha]AXC11131.1 hypothetical protein ACPOL_1789 [Acidisarcina polymorpha]